MLRSFKNALIKRIFKIINLYIKDNDLRIGVNKQKSGNYIINRV